MFYWVGHGVVLGGNTGINSAQTGDLTVVVHWDGGFGSVNQEEGLCCSHLSSLHLEGVCEHLEGAGSTRWGPGQEPLECWGNIPAVNRAPGEEPGLFPSETSLKRKGRENLIGVMKNVEFQIQSSCSLVDTGTLQSWI